MTSIILPFEIGQIVYFMAENKIRKGRIYSISISVWADSRKTCGYTYAAEYTTGSNWWTGSRKLRQDNLAATKEELMKKIIDD